MTNRKSHPAITDPQRKTPTQLLAEIALAQAQKRGGDPVSKVSLSQNSAGHWRGGVEVAHTDPYEAAKVALDIAGILAVGAPQENRP